MALHDTDVHRFMAFGIAGMSCMADSLSAIKYAKVRCVRDPETGLITDFEIEGRVTRPSATTTTAWTPSPTSRWSCFCAELKKNPLYRGAEHTLSILTITSNVMYGKKTGSTPDGRKAGEPLRPRRQPDGTAATAPARSPRSTPWPSSATTYCRDGISNTFSIVPQALGKTEDERVHEPGVASWTATSLQKAHHLNVNVLNRETLMDAYEHPEKYPNLTIRVSGYAVNFYKLSREQQREVIARTFHESDMTGADRIRSSRSARWTAPACGRSPFCRAARCAAPTATTPTPGTWPAARRLSAAGAGHAAAALPAATSGKEGGVTLTGGRAARSGRVRGGAVHACCRAQGVHTALDTSCTGDPAAAARGCLPAPTSCSPI